MQKNMWGSKCTKLIGMGDAAASICGDYFRWIYCDTVGEGGFRITDRCAWNGLSGGRFLSDDGAGTRLAYDIIRTRGG